MTNTNIKVGTFQAFYPISEIKFAKVNRDLVESHSENFSKKLLKHHWMIPVTISDKGDLMEGHHRVKTAILLNQKTVPAYIVDWVDTDNAKEHLDSIISLNNGNLSWNTLNYLKEYVDYNEDYKTVYDIYKANSNNISVGNIVNCFFGLSSAGVKEFKEGNCKIKDIDFAKFMLENFSYLNKEFGKRKIAAYCVREMIQIGYRKCQKDRKAMKHLFKKYEKMAIKNNLAIASISDFRPLMELYLNQYYKRKNKNK